MPAYSFQEQFVPFILDESKDYTVRSERAGRSRHARPGEKIYLYYGMRTKWCRKIGEATCSWVEEITITEKGIIVREAEDRKLSEIECDEFAWKDGFRLEGTTLARPINAFHHMLHFWRKTHKLPFKGVVIYWKDFKASASPVPI